MEGTPDPPEALADIERELEAQYVHTLHLMGLGPSEARRAFWHILNEIKADSLKTGAATLPTCFGDRLLERENTDERVKALLTTKRAEGVTDQDIRWWWNMHHLERGMMAKLDDLQRQLLLVRIADEEGLSPEEGAHKLKRYDPVFGEPDETDAERHDDRPLPYELKERVTRYIQKRTILNSAAFTRDIEDSSSLNALVRKELKRGAL